jgi:hypothetical protein
MLRNGLPVRHKGMGSKSGFCLFRRRLPGRFLFGQRISFLLLSLRADLLLRDRYVRRDRDSMWTHSPALSTAAQLAVHALSLAWLLMSLSSVGFLLVIGYCFEGCFIHALLRMRHKAVPVSILLLQVCLLHRYRFGLSICASPGCIERDHFIKAYLMVLIVDMYIIE